MSLVMTDSPLRSVWSEEKRRDEVKGILMVQGRENHNTLQQTSRTSMLYVSYDHPGLVTNNHHP